MCDRTRFPSTFSSQVSLLNGRLVVAGGTTFSSVASQEILGEVGWHTLPGDPKGEKHRAHAWARIPARYFPECASSARDEEEEEGIVFQDE